MMLPPNPVSALLLCVKEQVFPSLETRLQKAGPPRNARVLAEIARLVEHPWAGVYRTAGKWPDELALAPEAGFTLHNSSWCGTCEGYVSVGSVLTARESTLQLLVELQEPDNTSAVWYGLDETLHLVRWGDLSFAVAEGSMETFCAAVSDGWTFPSIPFRYVGERGDFDFEHVTRPTERPRVPAAFEHLILEVPVTCRVVSLVEWRRRPQLDGKERQAYDAVYALDAGSDDGLAVGMRLFVEGEKRWSWHNGRVERVESAAGRFQMLAFEDEREWAGSLVGKRATTRHPKAPER